MNCNDISKLDFYPFVIVSPFIQKKGQPAALDKFQKEFVRPLGTDTKDDSLTTFEIDYLHEAF